MTEPREQIAVSRTQYTELEARVEGTQFDDVDAYATYVFEELLHYLGDPDTEGISDQEQLTERLESLGYLQDD